MLFLGFIMMLSTPGLTPVLVDKAEVAFTIPEKTFIPEGIAYDAQTGNFFLGSIHENRILRIHPDGTYEEFVKAREHDLRSVLGMKVDSVRRVLWVNTATGEELRSAEPGLDALTGIFKFNVDTGELLAKSWVPMVNKDHLFNDMALDDEGSLYVTSFVGGAVYHVDGASAGIEPFLVMEGLTNNGIDFNVDKNKLFVSADNDIYVVDIAERTYRKLDGPEGVAVGHNDGLYMHEGHLIGIRHSMKEGQYFACVCRYELDEMEKTIIAVEEMLCNDPRFAIPTTGVLTNRGFYFIATSHLDKLDETGSIAEGAELSDIVIMRLPLN